MKRAHRLAHRRIWPALAAAVGLALVLALVLRPAPQAEAESFTVLEVLE